MRLSAFCLIATAFLACGINQSLAQEDSQIAEPSEPLGGQPAAGAKPSVPDLNYQVAYQRAFEAVIWSMPAVAIHGCRLALKRKNAVVWISFGTLFEIHGGVNLK
jgi:hypothetical protein